MLFINAYNYWPTPKSIDTYNGIEILTCEQMHLGYLILTITNSWIFHALIIITCCPVFQVVLF
jgi:hypothetical protein